MDKAERKFIAAFFFFNEMSNNAQMKEKFNRITGTKDCMVSVAKRYLDRRDEKSKRTLNELFRLMIYHDQIMNFY